VLELMPITTDAGEWLEGLVDRTSWRHTPSSATPPSGSRYPVAAMALRSGGETGKLAAAALRSGRDAPEPEEGLAARGQPDNAVLTGQLTRHKKRL